MHRLTRIATLALTTLLLMAATASAHVEVTPGNAQPGEHLTLTFSVPNHRTTPMTKLEIQFPAQLTEVKPQAAEAGWNADVAAGTDGTVVTWSGGSLAASAEMELKVDATVAATVAKGDPIYLPAVQTTKDGATTSWVEKRAVDAPESSVQYPAPMLVVGAAAATDESAAHDSHDAHNEHAPDETHTMTDMDHDPSEDPTTAGQATDTATTTQSTATDADAAAAKDSNETSSSKTPIIAAIVIGLLVIAALAALLLSRRGRDPRDPTDIDGAPRP